MKTSLAEWVRLTCFIRFVCTVLFRIVLFFVCVWLFFLFFYDQLSHISTLQLSCQSFLHLPHLSPPPTCSHLPRLLPHPLSGNSTHDSGGRWRATLWTYDPGMLFNEAIEPPWMTFSFHPTLDLASCEIKEKKILKLVNAQLFTLRLEVYF